MKILSIFLAFLENINFNQYDSQQFLQTHLCAIVGGQAWNNIKVRRYDNDKWIVSKLVDTYPPPTTLYCIK